MSGTLKYEVGQTVYVHSVNARGREPVKAKVTKVGRTLVTVEPGWYGPRPAQFRIDNGSTNDNYQHESIRTEDEERAAIESGDLHVRLRAAGLEVRLGHGLPLEVLRRVVEAAEATS